MKSKVNIKSVKVELVNYLGLTKVIELEKDQLIALNKQFTIRENIKRLQAACKAYSNEYWSTGYINGHQIAKYQWNQV